MNRSIAATGAAGVLAAASLTGCIGGSDALLIGASPTPHGEILEYISDNLAEDAGLEIEVKEFNDYSQPNPALDNGDLDANFFQHEPFLDDYNEAEGADLTPVTEVFVEPFAGYSSTIDSIEDLPDGAQVSIPNDATNGGRALHLLAENDLLTLNDDAGLEATESDIADNPQNLEIVPLEAAQLPRSLDDVDLALINGNYALEADLDASEDALFIEDIDDNPYGNFLVVRAENAEDENVEKLGELLNSDEVKQFMAEELPNSIPTF